MNDERIALTHSQRGFPIPPDVIKTLGRGDPEIGNFILLETFGVHPMAAPYRSIHLETVREIGGGDVEKGKRVLRKFIAKVRQHATEDKSTKAQAHYRNGTEAEHCAICTMFRAPNACTAVQGKISPQVLCDYFEKAHADAA